MGLSLTSGSRAIAGLTVVAVLLVGLTDWTQGSAPAGVLKLDDAVGLVLFAMCAVGVGIGSMLVSAPDDVDPARVQWFGVIVLATLASLIADPTYAVLLFAVPLVHVARNWADPIRQRTIIGVFVLSLVLVALEKQSSWSGTDLEATLVLFIALLITTMLGYVLGRLDDALQSESAFARRDEREQLAAELHDSVGHSLLASSIQLRTAQALWTVDQQGAQRSVSLASRAVDDALVDTRIAVDSVRAESEPFSLSAALPDLVDRVTSPSLRVDLTLEGDVDAANQLTQITLYRVAQEALTNVVRHADATTVRITHSASEAGAQLSIVDDGTGFDTEADSATLGLRGLEERLHRIGGTLAIDSAARQGTALTATVRSD